MQENIIASMINLTIPDSPEQFAAARHIALTMVSSLIVCGDIENKCRFVIVY